jgi:hypothetical protein
MARPCLRYCVTLKEPGKLSRYSDGVRAGRTGFDSQQREEIFLNSITFRRALLSTVQLASHLVGSGYQGVPSQRLKRPGLEADNSPPSNAVVKNGEECHPLSPEDGILHIHRCRNLKSYKNDEAILLLPYTPSCRGA